MVSHAYARRQRIIELYQKGLTPMQIARQSGERQPYVSKWIHNFNARGHVNDATRGGRRKKVTPQIVVKLRREAREKEGLSVRKLCLQLKGKRVNISKTSVWRGLRAAGLKAYHRPRKPAQGRGDKRARLLFATKHKDRAWRRVMFGDEKTFYLATLPNRKNDVAWASSADDVQPRGSTVLRGKLNVYAAISQEGQTAPFIFTENMTAESYINILQNTLLPTASKLYPSGKWTYVQDNDPKHRAKKAQAFVEQNIPENIFLPARSPDLNPIENVWAEVGNMVAKSQPKSLDDMRKAITKCWKKVVTAKLTEALMDSMPRRLAEVRRRRGAQTHF
jgi:transposase